MPSPSTAQNVPKVESSRPTTYFKVFSGTAASGRCATSADREDDSAGDGSPGGGERDVVGVEAERDHDEDDLEPLEEHPLERHDEREPVEPEPRSSSARRAASRSSRNASSSSCSAAGPPSGGSPCAATGGRRRAGACRSRAAARLGDPVDQRVPGDERDHGEGATAVAVPITVDRQPRVRPIARTIVRASTNSTNDASAVVVTSPHTLADAATSGYVSTPHLTRAERGSDGGPHAYSTHCPRDGRGETSRATARPARWRDQAVAGTSGSRKMHTALVGRERRGAATEDDELTDVRQLDARPRSRERPRSRAPRGDSRAVSRRTPTQRAGRRLVRLARSARRAPRRARDRPPAGPAPSACELDLGVRRHLVQGDEPDLRVVLDFSSSSVGSSCTGTSLTSGPAPSTGSGSASAALPAADSRINSTAGRRSRARCGPGSRSAAPGSNVSGWAGASTRGVRLARPGAGSPSGPTGRLGERRLLGQRACEFELADHALADERLAEALSGEPLALERLDQLLARDEAPRDEDLAELTPRLARTGAHVLLRLPHSGPVLCHDLRELRCARRRTARRGSGRAAGRFPAGARARRRAGSGTRARARRTAHRSACWRQPPEGSSPCVSAVPRTS